MNALKTRIETRRVQECIEFYTGCLGMQVLELWAEDRGAILGLGPSIDDAAFLEIALAEEERSHEGLSLQFRVADLDAVADGLRGRVDFRGPTARPWGSTYLYLTDPAGIQIIIYEGRI